MDTFSFYLLKYISGIAINMENRSFIRYHEGVQSAHLFYLQHHDVMVSVLD
jgi:hypothetical protein